jgi:hypothetical protein
MPRQLLKNTMCTCKHHKSAHDYGERSIDRCNVPDCSCIAFKSRQKAKEERYSERIKEMIQEAKKDIT